MTAPERCPCFPAFTSSHKSARRQGRLEEPKAHLMAHKESPSTIYFLKPILSASQRPVQKAIILTSFTVLTPEGPQNEISLMPALSLKTPPIPYWPGLTIALPSKLSFKVPSGGGFQVWQTWGRMGYVNATRLSNTY